MRPYEKRRVQIRLTPECARVPGHPGASSASWDNGMQGAAAGAVPQAGSVVKAEGAWGGAGGSLEGTRREAYRRGGLGGARGSGGGDGRGALLDHLLIRAQGVVACQALGRGLHTGAPPGALEVGAAAAQPLLGRHGRGLAHDPGADRDNHSAREGDISGAQCSAGAGLWSTQG